MTPVEEERLCSLFGTGPRGVLVTLKRDGRAQLSNVGYLFEAATRTIVISVTEGRAKTRNLQRDPRASFHVTTPDLGAYVVGEATAELGPIARQADGAPADQLVEHYRAVRGEHADWAEFRAAMVRERRLLVRLPLAYVYGWAPEAAAPGD